MELTQEELKECERWERKKEDGNYKTCWACGSRVLKKRIEAHHVIPKSDLIVPLCILCHDVVDRMDVNHPDIFYQFMNNMMQDFAEMIKDNNHKYKWFKLYALKSSKILGDVAKGGRNE